MQKQQRMPLLWVIMFTVKVKTYNIVICLGCNVVFALQILHTPHCFLHTSSSLIHCVYIIIHLVCAFDSVTINLFTSYQFPLPLTSHVFSYSCSRLSLCVAWGFCPPDCCPWRAPRRGQGSRSSVLRLANGEWKRPILHGPCYIMTIITSTWWGTCPLNSHLWSERWATTHCTNNWHTLSAVVSQPV